jgi:diacylglycerol kinase (ATP)
VIARLGLAVNPAAGGGRGERAGVEATRALAGAGIEVTVLTGVDAPDLARRAAHFLTGRPDGLVVVGGDGMVNLGVNLLAGTPTPLGIVPAGTGNDIARALGLPVGDWADAAGAVARALTADARRLDAVRCTGAHGTRWFAGVLGAGFDSVVNERANRWSWPRGRARYNLAIARELPTFRPREYRIELDGVLWTTPAMLVAVANGPSYGGGMRVCPDARMDDGLLDVLVVEPISRTEFVRIFPRVYSGTHVSHPRVVIRRAAHVRVDAPRIVGYADGERLGALPLECTTVPGALALLAPRVRP